MREKS